jgi:hypothetical protein
MSDTIITDGYSTTLTLATSDITLAEETTVKPPGLEGGDKIPRTTMANTAVRTFKPPSLYEVTDITGTYRFPPSVLTEVQTAINTNQQITVNLPDSSTWTFWGWLKTFEPGDFAEGAEVLADFTFCISNLNGSDAETAPVYAAAGS